MSYSACEPGKREGQRKGYATGRGGSPSPVQFHGRGSNLVLAGSRAAVVARRCQNTIVLSDEFYREICSHPIPTDLEAAKALSSSPAALDLFTWLSWSGASSLVWRVRASESARKHRLCEAAKD